MVTKTKTRTKTKSKTRERKAADPQQYKRFREFARKIEADDNPEDFDQIPPNCAAA